jgi:hypothetical protein
MIDLSVLAAMAAVHQDDADKRINFKNAFIFLAPSCPVLVKATNTGRISFEANVSDTGGKPHQGGLGGDCKKPGMGVTGVTLCYHKFDKFKNLPKSKEQQQELSEWNKAYGRGKKDGKKKGKCSLSAGSPCNNAKNIKKFKSSISEMEACQTKLFEAMADVQTTSVAAIHAASPRATGVCAVVGSAVAVAHGVMIEGANVAMLKLTGILKSNDKA